MKKTDLYALSLAAVMAASMSTANAADLGGNCCADLEERVAELEATVAKKGNRKVSLTISGHVNKAIMFWDAPNVVNNGINPANAFAILPGTKSGTYLGVDNQNSSTRFGFSGNATINSEWKAGFNILIDVAGGARSNAVNQLNEDSDINGSTQFRGDYGLRMRDANWWLELSRIGRVTVGRLTASGAVGTIDLGGIGVIASDSIGLLGGGFRIGNAAGQNSFNNWTDASGDFNQRTDGVKWTSPTVQGFVVSATIGETGSEGQITQVDPGAGFAGMEKGRVLGVDLKYANEFNGVRVAAGIGWERGLDEQHTPANTRTTSWGASLALLHTATGLFVQTAYLNQEVDSLPIGTSNDANKWVVQAGIQRNFFGIGNTNLYGEYIRSNDWLDLHTGALPGAATQFDSKVSTWGIGMVQNIDAAAMELYMGYRSHSFDKSALGPLGAAGIEDFSTFIAGARIKF